jgi:hypothetical protein
VLFYSGGMLKVFWEPENAPRGAKVIGQCGGQPPLNLMDESPICRVCETPMPYFFTVDIGEVLSGKLLSLFYCISCTGNTFPDFPQTPVSSPILTDEAQDLQKDYRIYLHTEQQPQGNPSSPILKKTIHGKYSKAAGYQFSKIGGTPTKYWGKDDNNIHKLLLQIREYDTVSFNRREGTPRQQEHKIFDNDLDFREENDYILFNGIPIYIFAAYDERSAFLVTGRF